MAASDIEWTEATWNPVAGCAKVSPGCTNCYALRMASRLQSMGHHKYQGTTQRRKSALQWSGEVVLDYASLELPITWKRPQRIFVNSMSDLFQDDVPSTFVRKLWKTMRVAHWHTFQVLTKRPERMLSVLTEEKLPVLQNVWLGTSVESGDYRSRIEHLRQTPAHVRFISFEPLLSSVGQINLQDIHWAIVGGESGPRARPIEKDWVEEIQEQCRAQGVAFFFKQWGGKRKHSTGRVLNGRTWDDYPSSESSRQLVPAE